MNLRGRGAGAIVTTVLVFLLNSAVSWADVKLIVVRNTATNQLKATVCDSSKASPCAAVIPAGNFTSSLLPTLGWNQSTGNWTIVGMTSSLTAWAGEITPAATFLPVAGTPEAPVSAGASINEPPFQQVAYEEPTTPAPVVCTFATSDWGPCQSDGLGGFKEYRTVVLTSEAGCTGAPPATSQTCTPPCQWQYSAWSACDPTSHTQTRTASGCPGTPDPLLLQQSCTIVCTDWAYSAWGTCVNNTQTRTITGSSPAGCTGTPTTQQVTQQACGTPCTDYTYSGWGTCSASGSMSRTVTGYTPGGCTGTPSASPVLTSPCDPSGLPILTDYVYGSGDYIPTIPANTTVYLTCTIPAGETSSLLAVSSLYQNTDLNVLIVQGSAPLTVSAADNYHADFADVYNKYGWLAYPFHMPNTLAGFTFRTPAAAPPAWAKMSTSLGGESIILKEGTSLTDTTISRPLAGKYYIVIKNTGPKDNMVKINWKRY